MKKNVLILFSTLLFFIGCESTKIEEKGTDSFITKYDDIEDISYFTHKELEIGYFYNLKDSISGERENISMYIADTNLIVTADYQYNILQSGKVNVAFLGKTNTNKMELKEKYKKAMLDTIKKFKSL